MRIVLDDRSKRGPANPWQVNLAEDYELRYWTAALSASRERLTAAVAKVGNFLPDVRRELSSTSTP